MWAEFWEINLHDAAEALWINEKSDDSEKKQANSALRLRSETDVQRWNTERLNIQAVNAALHINNVSISQRWILEWELHKEKHTSWELLKKFLWMKHSPEKVALWEKITRLRKMEQWHQAHISHKPKVDSWPNSEKTTTFSTQDQRQLSNLRKQLLKATLPSQKDYFKKEIAKYEDKKNSLTKWESLSLSNKNVLPKRKKVIKAKSVTESSVEVVEKYTEESVIAKLKANKDRIKTSNWLKSILSTPEEARLFQEYAKKKGKYNWPIDSIVGWGSLKAFNAIFKPNLLQKNIEVSSTEVEMREMITNVSGTLSISNTVYTTLIRRESHFKWNNPSQIIISSFDDMADRHRKRVYRDHFKKIAQHWKSIWLKPTEISAFNTYNVAYLKTNYKKSTALNLALGWVMIKTKENLSTKVPEKNVTELSVPRINELTKVWRNIGWKSELETIYAKIVWDPYIQKTYNTLLNYNGNNRPIPKTKERVAHKLYYAVANLIDARMV